MDAATDQAIDWLVRLDSGHASDDDRRAFAHWLRESPGHAQAWAMVQQRLSAGVEPALVQLRRQGGGTAALGLQALVAPIPKAARRRGLLRGGLAALLASTATAWLVHRQTPLTTQAAGPAHGHRPAQPPPAAGRQRDRTGRALGRRHCLQRHPPPGAPARRRTAGAGGGQRAGPAPAPVCRAKRPGHGPGAGHALRGAARQKAAPWCMCWSTACCSPA
ncbi:hypothetical protein CTI10_023580 [Delftia acidovorans]|nr:hypothetical protein CTI10_023580 [Delftia acidovorans]